MSVSIPRVGSVAPDFTATALIGLDFKEVTLSAYRGKWVVLYFYPLDFTFVCPTEIVAFSDRIGEFQALNTEVIGVSVDSHFTHFAWAQTPRNQGGIGTIAYPLVADLTHEVNNKYGAIHDESSGHSLRATFVIDPKGVIRHSSFNDPPIGRSVTEVIRIITAAQFTDEHGEVCPADWQKGDKTVRTLTFPPSAHLQIKTTPTAKLEFFSS